MSVAKHAISLVVCGKRRTRKTIVLSARQTDRQKSIDTVDNNILVLNTVLLEEHAFLYSTRQKHIPGS
jgi:hypothetical protein